MRYAGLTAREPARRASALYHLGRDVAYEAKRFPLGDDQSKVVSIFLNATEQARVKAMKETGYVGTR